MENKLINLVYDNWDEVNNCPLKSNCEDLYPECFQMGIDSFFISVDYPMEKIDRFPLSDVEMYANKKFFYCVTLMPNLICNNLLRNENPIPQNVIDCFKNNTNISIIFMNDQESEDFETFNLIHNWTKSKNLDQKRLWISNNNTKLNDYKTLLNSDINIHTTSRLPNSIATSMKNKIGNMIFNGNKQGDFFMCHNRRIRPHRYGLLCILKKNGILDNVDWSLVNGWEIKNIQCNPFYSDIFTQNDILEYLPEIQYFNNIDQKKSRYETEYKWFDDRSGENVKWSNIYEQKTFENSYVNITTESQFDQRLIHISEKSFKAFYAMQYPLILASPFHIKEIKKKWDFDFFDDVIDHSYDNIINNRDRLFKFTEEIKRINNNKEFFIEFYKQNRYRFIENNIKSLKWSEDKSDLLFLLKLPNKQL